MTAPAPNGDLAPDEEDEYNAAAVGDDAADPGVWSDPELGHEDSDDDGPAVSSRSISKHNDLTKISLLPLVAGSPNGALHQLHQLLLRSSLLHTSC